MITFIGNNDLFVKGNVDVTIFDEAGNTKTLLNQLSSAQFDGTINAGLIRGGLGMQPLTAISDTPDFKINFTAENLSPETTALQVGSEISNVAAVPFAEQVTLGTGGKGAILGTPVTRAGSADLTLIGTITKYNGKYVKNNNAVTFTYNDTTKAYEFTVSDGKEGDILCVEYYINKIGAHSFGMTPTYSPFTGRAVARFLVYSGKPTKAGDSSKWGFMYVIIPNGQFSPTVNFGGEQTANAKTVATFEARKNDGSPIECESTDNPMVIVTFDPRNADFTEYATALMGIPAELDGETGSTGAIIIKAVVDGVPENINYSDLKFVSATPATATVDSKGVVTYVAAGTTKITITPKDGLADPNNLTASVDVTVTAP